MNRKQAETALWEALEDRRFAHKKAKVTFSNRQHFLYIRASYDNGTLIADLCRAMEAPDRQDPYYMQAMARTIKAGLETFEHLLIKPSEPWSPYVTPAARRGAKHRIQSATAYIPYL